VANTCIESTDRFAMELGYHVNLVTDATAAFSQEMMHAAHKPERADLCPRDPHHCPTDLSNAKWSATMFAKLTANTRPEMKLEVVVLGVADVDC
jgi:hypothetical protein